MLIGFVPGMPNFLFISAALGAGITAFLVRRAELNPSDDKLPLGAGTPPALGGPAGKSASPAATDGTDTTAPDRIDLSDITDNSPVSIQLGYGLIEMVDEETGGPLVNRITSIRKQISRNLGFVIPAVRVRDDMSLNANQYRVRIGQTIVGEDEVYPDRKLAIPGEQSNLKLPGIEVKEPTFGIDAVWIEQHKQAEAERSGYVVVEPETVLTTHVSHLMNKFAGELLGQDDVQALLDNLSASAPSLVQSVIPKLIPLHSLTGILRELLAERMPISDLRRILETLANLAGKNLTIAESAEALRPGLAGLLIQQLAPLSQPLPVITLSSELEHMLIQMARQSGEAGLMLDNALAEKLITSVTQASERVSAEGRTAVMVVSPAIRKHLSAIIRHHIDDMVVLGFTELPDNRKINVVATISGEDTDAS
jgi:flagellar biosynthesis protein FlhA